jgi:hypothetical protein
MARTPKPNTPAASSVAAALNAAGVADPAVAAALVAPGPPLPPRAGAPTPAPVVNSAVHDLEAMLEADAAPPPGGYKRPFASMPEQAERLGALVSSVIDEGLDLDVNAEYDELLAALEIKEALTPQVVRAAVNSAESYAKRAHRLFVITKMLHESFRVDAETCLAACRDAATAELAKLKAAGQHPKQVTDRDVEDKAATMFPDEWSTINEQLVKGKHTLAHLERFADLWQRRSWSLSSLNNGN